MHRELRRNWIRQLGPNIVRNLVNLEDSHVLAIADVDPVSRSRAQKAHPNIPVTANAADIVRSNRIDAVAIISPAFTHYELAKAALKQGKHIFAEKPFTSTASQAEELIELAQSRNLRIMVDHTFLFTGAVKKIGQLVQEGTLGNLCRFPQVTSEQQARVMQSIHAFASEPMPALAAAGVKGFA